MVGGSLASSGAFAASQGKEERKARNKTGTEDAGNMTDDQKTEYNLARADIASGDVNRVKRGQGVLAQFGNEVHGAKSKDLVTSEPSQKKLRKDLEDSYKKQKNPTSTTGALYTDAEAKALASADFDKTMAEQLDYASKPGAKEFLQLSQAEKDSIEDTKTANLHLITPEGTDTQEQAVAKHLNKMKDAGRLKSGAISTAAIQASGPTGDAVRAAMKNFDFEIGKDGNQVKLWDKMAVEGTGDQKKAIAATVTPAQIAQYSVAGATTDEKKRAAQDVSTMVSMGRIPKMQKTNAADAPILDAVRDNLGAMETDLGTQAQGKATGQLIDAGYSAEEVLMGAGTAVGTPPSAGAVDRIEGMVRADASNAAHVDQWVPSEAALKAGASSGTIMANDVTRKVASVSKEDVAALYKHEPGESPATVARKKQALATIDRAVSAQLHAEDQKAQAAETYRKAEAAAAAFSLAAAAAVANQSAASSENTAATAALATKTPANAAQHASIDMRAATAAAELTKTNQFLVDAAAAAATATAAALAAKTASNNMGRENKKEMERLSGIHAKITGTNVTGTGRYVPA